MPGFCPVSLASAFYIDLEKLQGLLNPSFHCSCQLALESCEISPVLSIDHFLKPGLPILLMKSMTRMPFCVLGNRKDAVVLRKTETMLSQSNYRLTDL